ncbi:MAG: CoA transferase, partial [Gemmatimonadota bacterium]|nr:CoA transferase [Gemmatimonadota bacterium]
LATGTSPGAMGSAHPLTAPYQSFRTSDGWVNVGASNEATWTRLTDALGRPELRGDPRFADNAGRMRDLDELVAALTQTFATQSTDEWIAALGEAGVPVGPVASIGEMLDHPQTIAREMVVEVEHTRLGPVRSLGSPVKLSGKRSDGMRTGAPLLGEHTRAVLLEAGWSEQELAELVSSGSVYAP